MSLAAKVVLITGIKGGVVAVTKRPARAGRAG
jgi:hypothetical protein